MPAPEPNPQATALAALIAAVLGAGDDDYYTTEHNVRLYWNGIPTDHLPSSATAMTMLAGQLVSELVDPTQAPQVIADWARTRAVEHLEPEAQP